MIFGNIYEPNIRFLVQRFEQLTQPNAVRDITRSSFIWAHFMDLWRSSLHARRFCSEWKVLEMHRPSGISVVSRNIGLIVSNGRENREHFFLLQDKSEEFHALGKFGTNKMCS